MISRERGCVLVVMLLLMSLLGGDLVVDMVEVGRVTDVGVRLLLVGLAVFVRDVVVVVVVEDRLSGAEVAEPLNGARLVLSER